MCAQKQHSRVLLSSVQGKRAGERNGLELNAHYLAKTDINLFVFIT